MPDPIATVTAAAAAANRKEVRPGKTEVLLPEIIFGGKKPCEDACRKLLGHAFGLLPLDTQRRLLQQIISQGKITDANIREHEKYEIRIAIVQIQMAMHEYHEAKKVLGCLESTKVAIPTDARIPLFKAVIDMMLALETLLTGATVEDQVKDLIKSAKESWKNYYELKKAGLGTNPPDDELNKED